MRADAAVVRDFLARGARRLAVLSAANGAAVGLTVALALALAGWPRRGSMGTGAVVGVVAAIAGALISVFVSSGRRLKIAQSVEARAPESRNLLVTADELLVPPAYDYVHELVFARAARLVRRLDARTLFPARIPVSAFVTALVLWLLVLARPVLPLPASLGGPGATAGANGLPSIDAIDVVIQPPAYTGQGKTSLRDPSRVEALAGSRITINVRARAERVSLETISAHDSLTKRGSIFVGNVVADADGYIALQPTTADHGGARRLIGLTVLPDLPPRVRIVTPGHDQRFDDGHRQLELTVDASDDIALASLKLRFTKVSGSGERFTFAESETPLSITRRDERTWTAHGTLNLDSLALEPGDMVVYRAVAADKRPTGGTAESDSYIAEILAPGGIAASGFETDPEQDRYAVSQQMVILKTERLLARLSTLSADSLQSASQEIAAEQRKVRAEFVFMLGGELADAPDVTASMTDLNEEQEAEGEADILAGRNANAGHIALLRAIRAMSRAAASLTVSEPTTALPYERTALTQLESAFARSRILLRALSTRERLDLSRRLTGSLTDAARDIESSAEPAASSRVVALRRVLSEVATIAGTKTLTSSNASAASAIAERALRVDPSSKTLQEASSLLAAAADAIAGKHERDARERLDRASSAIVAALRTDLLDAPTNVAGANDARLSGALVDALRSRPE
ncbi:MAG: hypothetical protein ABI442_13885 [Gemmatimonadaceae bacterium]